MPVMLTNRPFDATLALPTIPQHITYRFTTHSIWILFRLPNLIKHSFIFKKPFINQKQSISVSYVTLRGIPSHISFLRDSIQIIPSKHSNSVSFLPLYCMFYITFISVLIHSLILILRHLILTTFYALSGTLYPSDIISLKLLTSLRTNHTKVCSIL